MINIGLGHYFGKRNAILIQSSQAGQLHPAECLDSPLAAYGMPICRMPYTQIWHIQPYLGIFGHMAYGIQTCCMWHVGCPGTQLNLTSHHVKTRPKLHCHFQSYGPNQYLSCFPPLNGLFHTVKTSNTSNVLRSPKIHPTNYCIPDSGSLYVDTALTSLNQFKVERCANPDTLVRMA